ncbi:MAG: hypothetical protein N3H30_01880 [Candidatus Micrarchaeota archaeon]|nr:hypothetical protein [Candidatus Micrarchaeota archaeon]
MEFQREALLIAAGAVVLVALGLLAMQSLSYSPQQLSATVKNASTIAWRDVYRISDVSEYRYEITYIKGGAIEWADALYAVSPTPEGYAINITTYDGILPSNSSEAITVSPLTYSCISQRENGSPLECGKVFSSRQAQLASQMLPTMLRPSEKLEAGQAVSGVYQEKAVQALILSRAIYRVEQYTAVDFDNETNTSIERAAERLVPIGKINVWAVDGMPVPLRIERTYEDGGIAIANLKHYK